MHFHPIPHPQPTLHPTLHPIHPHFVPTFLQQLPSQPWPFFPLLFQLPFAFVANLWQSSHWGHEWKVSRGLKVPVFNNSGSYVTAFWMNTVSTLWSQATTTPTFHSARGVLNVLNCCLRCAMCILVCWKWDWRQKLTPPQSLFFYHFSKHRCPRSSSSERKRLPSWDVWPWHVGLGGHFKKVAVLLCIKYNAKLSFCSASFRNTLWCFFKDSIIAFQMQMRLNEPRKGEKWKLVLESK